MSDWFAKSIQKAATPMKLRSKKSVPVKCCFAFLKLCCSMKLRWKIKKLAVCKTKYNQYDKC